MLCGIVLTLLNSAAWWTDGPAADVDGARDVLLVDGTTEYLARLSHHGLGRPQRRPSYCGRPYFFHSTAQLQYVGRLRTVVGSHS